MACSSSSGPRSSSSSATSQRPTPGSYQSSPSASACHPGLRPSGLAATSASTSPRQALHFASTLLGRSLWLWLGVLDALQCVGFGMILLQTLTRIHISAALVGSPVLSSATTMLVHAAQSGDGNGPGTLFPSFAARALPGLVSPWFWVGFDITVVCLCGILCVL